MPRKKDPLAVAMGQRVTDAAEALELSIPDLARLLGVEYNTLSRSLAGWHRIQYDVLLRMTKVLHRSLYYFFGLPDPRGLDEGEQELIDLYRSYQNPEWRRALLEDARSHLRLEQALRPPETCE